MPRSSAEEIRLEARRLKAAELYLRGMRNFSRIAKELHVNRSQVSRDFKRIRQLWRETYIEDLNVAKQEELARIAEIEQEAWLAWQRSCKDAETMEVTGTTQGGKGKPDKVKKVTKERAGDARFLAIVVDCMKWRCEILGLVAAKKNEVTGTIRGQVQVTVEQVVQARNRVEEWRRERFGTSIN